MVSFSKYEGFFMRKVYLFIKNAFTPLVEREKKKI